jgi:hypothetical protein
MDTIDGKDTPENVVKLRNVGFRLLYETGRRHDS